MREGQFIVIDIGKTLAKVSLWSVDGQLLDRHVRPNHRCESDGIPHLDTDATAGWVFETLKKIAGHPVRYIIPVAHGAAVAAIRENALAFAPLDYEAELPEQLAASYRAQRDPFTHTGSPALPAGLNLGSQLHWLENRAPKAFRDATLMPYAQYWAWLFTGVAISEVSSLGCHSDLWNPSAGDYSLMAKRRGWAGQFAPIVGAGDVVGTIKPDIARSTGLSPEVEVVAGIHDSNAALLAARGFADIDNNEATVLSTGTWFVAMRLPKETVDLTDLPEARDCLVNIDAFGHPVPSARFMGGREIETLIEIDTRQVDIKPDQPRLLDAVSGIVGDGAMILPTFAPGSGPFHDRAGCWVDRPDGWYARRAAACLYAALLADTSLDLIGAQQRLLVEGRFAEAEVFVRALATLRPDMQVYVANAHNDVSFGALRLVDPGLRQTEKLRRVEPLETDLSEYRARWHAAIEAASPGGETGQ